MKYKNLLISIIMICLLAMMIMAPVFLYQQEDQKMLNHFYVEDLVEETRTIEKSNLTTLEKLDLLARYHHDDQVVSSSHKENLSDENKQMLDETLSRELQSLKELGIILLETIPEHYEYDSYITQIFSDTSQANSHVSLWYLSFINENGYFEVWIDIETQKIYQFLIQSENCYMTNDKSDVLLNEFCQNYLGLDKTYENYTFIYISQIKSGNRGIIEMMLSEEYTYS